MDSHKLTFKLEKRAEGFLFVPPFSLNDGIPTRFISSRTILMNATWLGLSGAGAYEVSFQAGFTYLLPSRLALELAKAKICELPNGFVPQENEKSQDLYSLSNKVLIKLRKGIEAQEILGFQLQEAKAGAYISVPLPVANYLAGEKAVAELVLYE